MNKKAQILIGVGILSVAGYFYWKSTQTASFTAKKNFGGNGIKPIPRDFFKTEGSVDAINNFKNADGVFKKTPKEKIFKNADGIFQSTSKEKVFANASGDAIFDKTAKEKIFANADGIFQPTSKQQVFANMTNQMNTHNSGYSFM